jgi:hypothetical protein
MGAFDMLKSGVLANFRDRLQEMPIISYGFVTGVHSATLVDVEASIQVSSKEKEVYTIRLLSPSSALKEEHVEPVIGDLVLLFFTQRYSPAMFTPPAELRAASGQGSVYDPEARGYNVFSGVGILFSVFRDCAVTQINHFIGGDGVPGVSAKTSARMAAYFGRALDLVFDRDEEAADSEAVSVLFGINSPLTIRHRAAVLREHGFQKAADGTLEAVNAPVEERFSVYAPITRSVQGSQTLTAGIGEDADGNPEETEAPVTETYGSKAPITRTIRAGQTVTIGVAEDGSDTEAPVSFTFGGEADVSVSSKSGLTLAFDKPVSVVTKDALNLEVDGTEKVHLGNSAGDIKALLDGIIDLISGLVLVTPSGPGSVDPSSQTQLALFKQQDIAAVFE